MSVERKKCTSGKIHRTVYQERVDRRKEQLDQAVLYCKDNDCRGWKALKTGLFPLVKSPYTVNRYLDGELSTLTVNEYCSLITAEEEDLLVTYLLNRNRAYQPLS